MDVDYRQPKDELPEICIEGLWFLPSPDGETVEWKDVEKVAGTFRFSVSGGGRLELLGLFSSIKKLGYQVVPVIFGVATDGSKVTLFDAVTSGMYGNGDFLRMSFRTLSAWRSQDQFFSSKKDVKFEKWSFGVNGLLAWDGRNGFVSSHLDRGLQNEQDASVVAITYKKVEDVLLYEDELVIISLTRPWSSSLSAIVQSEGIVRDYARIVIASKGGRIPYYGSTKTIESYEEVSTSLLMMLIGAGSFTYDRRGAVVYELPQEGMSPLRYEKLSFFLQARSLAHDCTSRDNDDKIDFPRKELADVVAMFSEYAKVFKECRGNIYKILRYPEDKDSPLLEKLQNLIYACNGIAESLFEKEGRLALSDYLAKAPASDALAVKQRVFDCLKGHPDLIQWLEDSGKKEGPSFAMFLRGAFVAIKDAVPCFADASILGKIINYLKYARKAGAHALSDKTEFLYTNTDLMAYMAGFMYYLLRALLLFRCGMPIGNLRASVTRPLGAFAFFEKQVASEVLKFKA